MDGNVVNDIKCPNALELYFGDERYLFCRGMGSDKLMYIDKKNIETATQWTDVFSESLDLIDWGTEKVNNK